MRAPFVFPVAVSLLVLAGACRRQPEPSGREESQRPSASARAGERGSAPDALLAERPAPAKAAQVPPLTWTDPPGWTRASSPSPMRLATYRVPMEAGDPADGEMTVFHFGGGQGGGVDANFDRWISQFPGLDRAKAKRSERNAHGLAEHVLEIENGTFASSMRPGEPEAPSTGYGLLGAIVETPGGPYFFKLIGPAKTIKAARAAFFQLLEGMQQP